ncbi:hypothetical protein [Candidatus Nanohalobium constans]|uniref:Uncharacterized protein n=1 Tax=Candidatus Nanohalobium constans TaxID=2565781 RepID=A0A5Q0UGA3_9ARCH|nr:hypothetical protein [Candidatus Nanohalobium constans]QGA80230.1 hypothetical protein LC1Nh_0329 [Candidatus Nanohalobium constans]
MELELDLELDKAKAGFLTAGILIGIIASFGFANSPIASPDNSQRLVSFLENQSGQDLEALSTENAGQFQKIDVRTEDDQLTTYYTDGEKFTSQMQDIEQLRQQTQRLADFSQCLQDSGTVMFGNTSQRSTQAQIQALGGTQVVAPIYQDVSNNQTIEAVRQIGLQQVPAFYRNQSAIQGTQQLDQVEQFTGCSLEN